MVTGGEKMRVTVMRVDDRLIHGQIITRWIDYAEAKRILVVDDKAAGDAMQQMLLKLAVPSGIKLEILSKEEGIKRIQSDTTNDNVLLLMRNPEQARQFLEMGFEIKTINIGNISNSKSETGRKKILDYIYLEEGDVAAMRALLKMGIQLDVRAIPTERAKDGAELLKKY